MKQLKELVKLILSNKWIRLVRRRVGKVYARAVSSTYLLSIPVSVISPFKFMREQRAVMAGKGQYYASLTKQHSKSLVGLRRNVHRLEKALLMRPRRDMFAKDYIMETVEWYVQALRWWRANQAGFDESELNWAHNVLGQYFQAVKTELSPVADEARRMFNAQTYKPKQSDMYPYRRLADVKLPSYKQMLALSMHRRSVRWYLPKKVARKDIDEALLVARQSPTACNRLPYEFKIFDDPQLVKKVANTPFGTAGYADNIPVIAVLVGKLDSYFSARDRHAIYVDTSLAAMSFAFALETKGISTCMINWPDFEPLERKMQKLLGLRVDERPIMLMAIGYADPEGFVAYSQKKSLDGLRTYNFEA